MQHHASGSEGCRKSEVDIIYKNHVSLFDFFVCCFYHCSVLLARSSNRRLWMCVCVWKRLNLIYQREANSSLWSGAKATNCWSANAADIKHKIYRNTRIKGCHFRVWYVIWCFRTRLFVYAMLYIGRYIFLRDVKGTRSWNLFFFTWLFFRNARIAGYDAIYRYAIMCLKGFAIYKFHTFRGYYKNSSKTSHTFQIIKRRILWRCHFSV